MYYHDSAAKLNDGGLCLIMTINRLIKCSAAILTLFMAVVFFSACSESGKAHAGNGGGTDGDAVNPTAGAAINPTAEPTPEQEDPMKAKVIIIAGQSNAVGATPWLNVRKSMGKEKYNEYRKGYENVKIAYYCEAGGANGANAGCNFDITGRKEQSVDDIFDGVKFGQSWHSSMFGPEVGMAEYLTENYPDQTFYIIKVAKGAVSIPSHWTTKGFLYKKLAAAIDVCFGALEKEGYHPEIISFCWMQGEDDASKDDLTEHYSENLASVVENLRSDYAKYALQKEFHL